MGRLYAHKRKGLPITQYLPPTTYIVYSYCSIIIEVNVQEIIEFSQKRQSYKNSKKERKEDCNNKQLSFQSPTKAGQISNTHRQGWLNFLTSYNVQWQQIMEMQIHLSFLSLVFMGSIRTGWKDPKATPLPQFHYQQGRTDSSCL